MGGRNEYPSGPNTGEPTKRLSGMIPGKREVVKSRASTTGPRSAQEKADGAGKMVPGAGKIPTRSVDR